MQKIEPPSSREERRTGKQRGGAGLRTSGPEELQRFKTGLSKASAQLRLSNFKFSHSHMYGSAPSSISSNDP